MARRRTKRSVHIRKQRQRRHARTATASYRHSLQEAIGQWFPGQFFSRWALKAGVKWTPLRLFWMALLMVWSCEQTLQSRFEETRGVLRSLFPKWSLGTTYTGWYEAQLTWLTPLQPAISKRLRQQTETLAGKQWLREGWCAFAADGSRVECPRTAANERELKRAGREKTTPQLFVTTLLHMGTGLPWDFRIGPGTASERRHLEDMLADLPPRALLVADAGFTGYEFYGRLLAAKQNFLMRVGSNVHLLQKLGYVEHEGPDLVYLWPDRNWDGPPVVLRLIERHQDAKKMYLVTNVLDHEALSQESAGVLYEMRWGVEVFYRSLKQTMGKRKLLSHSPDAARCELTWALYGRWMLQGLTVANIVAQGRDPLRWSAAKARDRIRKSMRSAIAGRDRDPHLAHDLGRALKDNYTRHGSKKARAWPHKKREKPPGDPKIQLANAEQLRAIKQLKLKREAA